MLHIYIYIFFSWNTVHRADFGKQGSVSVSVYLTCVHDLLTRNCCDHF